MATPRDPERAEMAAIWAEFHGATLRRVDAIDRAVAALREGTLGDAERREARTEAHTPAGSTALFDLDRASSIAGQLEYAFGMQAIGLNDVTRLEHPATSLRRALERTVLPP